MNEQFIFLCASTCIFCIMFLSGLLASFFVFRRV